MGRFAEAVYEGLMAAIETIVEWVIHIAGALLFFCILPIMWLYMYIYIHYIEEKEN